jgi:uncharacterized protein
MQGAGRFMKIEIKEILKQIGSKKKVASRESIELKEIGQWPPVDVDLEITNAQTRIIVKGRLATSVELSCGRCAEKYLENIDIAIHEEFLPEGSPELEPKPDLSLNDLSVFVYKDETLDLGEIIRQNIISAFPIKPLCNSDCKGLCGTCGENLNKSQCDCSTETIDPRLSSLLKFKKESP